MITSQFEGGFCWILMPYLFAIVFLDEGLTGYGDMAHLDIRDGDSHHNFFSLVFLLLFSFFILFLGTT